MIRILHNIIFVLLFSCQSFAYNLIFDSEVIDFYIDGNWCKVNAEYYFINPSDNEVKKQPLFYPFPVNDYTPFPDSISVLNNNKENTEYFRSGNGIFFNISIPPQSTVMYKVSYKQKLRENIFEYILTSTRKWGRPLSSAKFKVIIDNSINLKSLSYIPDKEEVLNDKYIYYISREYFLPSKNLIIKWQDR